MRFEDVKLLAGYATFATELIEMSYDVVSDQGLVDSLIAVMDSLIDELQDQIIAVNKRESDAITVFEVEEAKMTAEINILTRRIAAAADAITMATLKKSALDDSIKDDTVSKAGL